MRTSATGAGLLGTSLLLVLAACGGGGPTPTPTAEPTPAATPTSLASAAATPVATPNTGSATLDGPDEVSAGSDFEVAWTGPAGSGDYVTIVPAGATGWTSADDYFNTDTVSPGALSAPLTAGAYELWYVSGADDSVLARSPITVTAFTGELQGPDEVAGGTKFQVAWNGPNASGDYVTIVPVGADESDYLSYVDAPDGSPATLVAPVKAGAYELWYVSGSPVEVMLRRPITVTPVVATVKGPDSVKVAADFKVDWTGPDGPGDYITIVPVGSDPGAYLSYWYTADGTPAQLTAPGEPGDYELWYVIPGRREGPTAVFARQPIEVKP